MQIFPSRAKIQWIWQYIWSYPSQWGEDSVQNDCLFFAGLLLQPPPQSPLAHSNIAPCHAAPCHAVYPWSQQQLISSVMPRVPGTLPCTPYPSARPAQPALVSSPPNLPQFPPLWWLTCTLPFNFLVHKALNWCYFQLSPVIYWNKKIFPSHPTLHLKRQAMLQGKPTKFILEDLQTHLSIERNFQRTIRWPNFNVDIFFYIYPKCHQLIM